MSGTKPPASTGGSESWLERVSPHEGPEGTLFMYSKGERVFYVLGSGGTEAKVPARDLRSFVAKCIAAGASG